jgi:hypothetical protein
MVRIAVFACLADQSFELDWKDRLVATGAMGKPCERR